MVTIESVKIVSIPDDDPDLSWLDQTDDQMGAGFEASARTRKRAYERGLWDMVGIHAQATILITPNGYGGTGILQTIESPGLWGIESDSRRDYFEQVGREELETLRDMLTELGVPGEEIDRAYTDAQFDA